MAGAVITLASITEAATKSVLTVGSGDGSQQAAVARAGHKRLTCTFMDSEEEVCSLYVSARAHIEYLKGQGVPLLFSVDAMQLGTGNGPLGADCKTRFDLISWYFPHSGATPNDAPHAVESNRRLIRAFLAAAPRLLKRGGTIQVTVMRGPPYDHWRVPELLPEDADLALLDVRSADNSAFRGYTHRLTNTDGSVSEQRDAELFVFGRRDGDAAAATPQAGAALDAAGPRRAGEP
ncbi:hypothetical protein FOA52_005053 [Chlamydomonas sp. UWO 241]|nr:hypothetical protein FOA52_005053 [Chlamydomonas sp. UWO 241]